MSQSRDIKKKVGGDCVSLLSKTTETTNSEVFDFDSYRSIKFSNYKTLKRMTVHNKSQGEVIGS